MIDLKQAFSLRRMAVITLDSLAILFAFVLAFLLRFDFQLNTLYFQKLIETAPYIIAVYLISGQVFSLYAGIYYYSSFADLLRITKSVATSGIVLIALIMFIQGGRFPRSVLLLHPILAFLGICGVRFVIRLIKTRTRLIKGTPFTTSKRVLLVGAGEMGESLLRQIAKTPELGYDVIGLIDDDERKMGMKIHDCPVLGGRATVEEVVRKFHIDEIIIAIVAKRGEIARSVVESIRNADPKPELKIAPSLDEILGSRNDSVGIRKVKPSDLLNRNVIRLDEPKISKMLENKCLLVSGAGGTIGAELCRQALHYRPEKIILLENHATSLFYRDREFRDKSQGSAIVSVLGDVRDQGLLERIFLKHKPDIVFHAAAHKHVHQLESNIPEAISNNIMGTYHIAKASVTHKVKNFLLVSTDKAVRPSSIMGATKQAAEQVVRNFSHSSDTRFCAVRFGNVLGSSGSVLKIFQEQIAKGGPITVTDARATRYFMTVEESVGLILQAITMADGGEIFVLKMGTPVRIIDMAQNLVLLSGLEIGKDIEIKITGLKQGEKLDEELMEDPAGISNSTHPDIFLLGKPDAADLELEKRILDLEIQCRGISAGSMLKKLQEIIPSFNPDSAHTTITES